MLVAVIAVVSAVLATTAPATALGAENNDVVRAPVSFVVRNDNHARLPCPSDGLEYRIEGELVGPAHAFDQRQVEIATLYLHEFSFGRFFWSFEDVPGYDFAGALARAGHVAVVIDRLGYGSSDHPLGTDTCLGAQADIAAQIVRQLIDGTYQLHGPTDAIAFRQLVLAGHSVGGGVAELAAHSFPDLDIAGLMLLGWADQGYSARSVDQAAQQGRDCSGGGEPAYDGGPAGYAFFGGTEADFQANVFHDADPEVIALATAQRNRDPCGDSATLARMAAVNLLGVGEISVPVLLLFGDEDAVFTDGAAEQQQLLFRGSSDVTLHRFPGMGHALALERKAVEVQVAAHEWLTGHGFAPAASGPPDGTGSGDANTEERAQGEGAAAAEGDLPAAEELPVTGGGGPVLAALLLALAALIRRDRGHPDA